MKSVIGLMGVKESGKSTVASILAEDHDFIILEPGRQVMDLLLDINPAFFVTNDLGSYYTSVASYYEMFGYSGFKRQAEGRRLLQQLGTRIRERDPVFWVEQQRRVIEESSSSVVHASVRFPNEARLVTGWGGELWLIENDRVEDTADHESETAWRELVPTRIIENRGTLSDLRSTVRNVMDALG